MKTIFLQLESGAAGDMLAAALLQLVPDPEASLARIRALGVPGVEVSLAKAARCGIAGALFDVRVGGQLEEQGMPSHEHHHAHDHEHSHEHEHTHEHEHHHEHEHTHEHHHHHEHADMVHIRERIAALNAPETVRDDVRATYDLLAAAESAAHGRPVELVHFHEVGALDALVDIASVCLLLREIAPDRIVATPPNAGGGTVRCAHGIMPVPAPATEHLLQGIPWRGDAPEAGELLTPTGAALLRRFVSEWGPAPEMVVEKSGYGLGHKEREGRANAVRALLGRTVAEASAAGPNGRVCQLAANLDDMTGEELAFACDRIREAGALDVSLLPALMKKGRPGNVLLALAAPEAVDAVAAAILRHTSTFGLRRADCTRYELSREFADIPLAAGGTARLKTGRGYGAQKSKPEFEDVAAAALAAGIPLREAVPQR